MSRFPVLIPESGALTMRKHAQSPSHDAATTLKPSGGTSFSCRPRFDDREQAAYVRANRRCEMLAVGPDYAAIYCERRLARGRSRVIYHPYPLGGTRVRTKRLLTWLGFVAALAAGAGFSERALANDNRASKSGCQETSCEADHDCTYGPGFTCHQTEIYCETIDCIP